VIGTTGVMSFGGGEVRRRCSFCGRQEEAVKHLVRACGAYICDRCVAQAYEAVASAAPDQKLLLIRPVVGYIADRDAAEVAVEQAFETVFGGGKSDDEDVCQAIEQGDNLGPAIEEARQRNPGTRVLDMSVDYVRFLSEDEAEVHFTLWLSQFGSSGLPQTGHAVKVGDDWKVSREHLVRARAHERRRMSTPGGMMVPGDRCADRQDISADLAHDANTRNAPEREHRSSAPERAAVAPWGQAPNGASVAGQPARPRSHRTTVMGATDVCCVAPERRRRRARHVSPPAYRV
jgi:ClpX C4-type zinc finger